MRESIYEEYAKKLRIKAGLSLTCPINAKTLLRTLGIMTVYRPMSKDFFGLSTSSGDYKFMLVNSNSTRGRQHFTIGHELYHLYYDEHPEPHICGMADGSRHKSEKAADAFSSALLMPEETILSNIPNKETRGKSISIATILKMEQLFGVSHQSMILRLKKVGLINEKTVGELIGIAHLKELAESYGFDTSLYEKGNEGLVIGDYGIMAKRLFDDEKISEGHYNELMNLLANGKD